MKVGHYNKNINDINSKYVLPIALYDEYCQYYNNKANSLLVSISDRQYNTCRYGEKSIKFDSNIKEDIIYKYYDDEIGLTREDVDMINSSDCFIL